MNSYTAPNRRRLWTIVTVAILALAVLGFLVFAQSPWAQSRKSAKPINDARFTGNYSYQAVDTDSDSLFNKLSVTVEVEVLSDGKYLISGSLFKNDTLITQRPSSDSEAFSLYQLDSSPGIANITLDFSGEDIQSRGKNGTYKVKLNMIGLSDDIKDTLVFQTSPYSSSDFGELALYITGSSISGLDTDVDGLYNYLVANISLDVKRSEPFTFQAVLFKDTGLITSEYGTPTLGKGSQSFNLSLDGREIRKSKLDGPYFLRVSVYDTTGSQIDLEDFLTPAYTYTSFQIK